MYRWLNGGWTEAWAEDVVQEVLLDVLRGLRTCRAGSEAEPRAWVAAITRRQVATLFRREMPRLDSTVSLSVHPGLADFGPSEPSPRLLPLLAALVDATEDLPSSQSRLLWMRIQTHATWGEVGANLGIPATAAKRRYQRLVSLEIVWRAEAQKGGAYGQGDVAQPATRQLKVVYRWHTRFHPNPLGPEYPLIWAEADPTRAESYDRLGDELEAAWHDAFAERKPKGLGWHAFCRTTITTLADEIGTLGTADFVGRSVKRVESTYRRVRRETVRSAARRLDQVRRGRRIKAEWAAGSEVRHG